MCLLTIARIIHLGSAGGRCWAPLRLRVYYIINNINSLDSIYSIIAQWASQLPQPSIQSGQRFIWFLWPHTTPLFSHIALPAFKESINFSILAKYLPWCLVWCAGAGAGVAGDDKPHTTAACPQLRPLHRAAAAAAAADWATAGRAARRLSAAACSCPRLPQHIRTSPS